MPDEEIRPMHVVIDCTSGESTEIPVTDAEWDAIKQDEADIAAAHETEQQVEAALREAVQNHSDPVVKALGKRLGLI